MSFTEAEIQSIRSQFPALQRPHGGRQAVFFDGPAGTQVPQCVIEAISSYLVHCNANSHGHFATSLESDAGLESAHQAVADLLGAKDPDCVIFGPNMTTLTLGLARSLSRTWTEKDEVLLSGLEHDANFTPWVQAAEDAGARVQVVDVNQADCTLNLNDFKAKLSERTKFVAIGCASNAAGTVNPVSEMCAEAKRAGALTFLDAVHYAPHDLIDVEALGCDFLACSAYKFFGPHVGMLWGRRELLEGLQPYKLRPSPNQLPGRWMTGTQNHECIMGTKAAVDYLARLGRKRSGDVSLGRRASLKEAYSAIRAYERQLSDRLLDGLSELPEIKVWGITEPENRHLRLPTVSISHSRFKSEVLARELGERGVYVWHGNYYALPLTERIGVEPDGMVRIGLVHYNTAEEVDYLITQLKALS